MRCKPDPEAVNTHNQYIDQLLYSLEALKVDAESINLQTLSDMQYKSEALFSEKTFETLQDHLEDIRFSYTANLECLVNQDQPELSAIAAGGSRIPKRPPGRFYDTHF